MPHSILYFCEFRGIIHTFKNRILFRCSHRFRSKLIKQLKMNSINKFLFLVIMCFFLYLFLANRIPVEEYGSLNLILDHPKCKLIDLPPFDPLISYYMDTKPDRIYCPNPFAKVTEDLRIKILKPLTVSSCSYKEIIRVTQNLHHYNFSADRKNRYGESLPLTFDSNWTSLEKVTSPHFVLECNQVSLLSLLPPRVAHFAPIISTEDFTKQTKAKSEFWSAIPIEKRPPSIIMIGFDTVSRLQFLRTMPEAQKALKLNNFTALHGYTRIGYNTQPNLLAILTGLKFGKNRTLPCRKNKQDTFSRCHFIWSDFSALNYITAFQEDEPFGAIFNFETKGFVQQPTDYYLRPFFIELDKENAKCPHGMPRTDFLRIYTGNIAKKIGASGPLFSLTWFTEMAHESISTIKFEDEDFAKLIHEMSIDLPNAFLIFLSDHGMRYSSRNFKEFRKTFRGYFEESLPFFFMRVPSSFKSKYPEWENNFLTNARRLTTPFDVHSTLEQILLKVSQSEIYQKAPGIKPIRRRSRFPSLFEEIPKNRTCKDAWIDPEWCRCGVSPIESNSTLTLELGQLIIDQVNSYLNDMEDCAFLKLNKINSGKWVTNTDNSEYTEYLVFVEATPGNGFFEGKIRVFQEGTNTIVGDISRINSYGSQSKCINDPFLKSYCYCK